MTWMHQCRAGIWCNVGAGGTPKPNELVSHGLKVINNEPRFAGPNKKNLLLLLLLLQVKKSLGLKGRGLDQTQTSTMLGVRIGEEDRPRRFWWLCLGSENLGRVTGVDDNHGGEGRRLISVLKNQTLKNSNKIFKKIR